MAKSTKQEEREENQNFVETSTEIALDLDLDASSNEVKSEIAKTATLEHRREDIKKTTSDQPLVSCLRNEKLVVRFIPRDNGVITNPKHVFYGGMAATASMVLTVPIMESSQTPVNVLTNAEKSFLEEYMALPPNALSVYNKTNNYWTNYKVRLTKGDNILNLQDPDDYIKWKVLLANKDIIAPSLNALQSSPRATYKFVIVSDKDEANQIEKSLSATMEAYMLLGAIKDDIKVLKTIIELVDGRSISPKATLVWLQGQANNLILANAKLFVSVAKDPYLKTKILIKDCVDAGFIKKVGDFYYLPDNSPLCFSSKEPTLDSVLEFINSPKNQNIKFHLEAKLKTLSE